MNPDRIQTFRALGPQRPYIGEISLSERRLLRKLTKQCPTFIQIAQSHYGRRIETYSVTAWLWNIAVRTKENIPDEELRTAGFKHLRAEVDSQREFRRHVAKIRRTNPDMLCNEYWWRLLPEPEFPFELRYRRRPGLRL